MDLFQPCYDDCARDLARRAGLYPYFRALERADGPAVRYDGRDLVLVSSDDYLGLARHPDVVAAARNAVERYGPGCAGSRLHSGNLCLHEALESEVADFLGKEAALVFASGFLANLGVIEVLARPAWTVVFSERESHAGLLEGTRLARGEVRVFDDVDHLEAQLAVRDDWSHALVATEAVFAMTGRVADLERLAVLRRRFGFRLCLDDAHGVGVLGRQGRGTADAYGVANDVDVTSGSFSKAFASGGGFVAGEAKVIDFLRHHARSLISTAALPPASAAAALAALRVTRREPERFSALRRNVAWWRAGLERLGYRTLGGGTPIVPVLVGSEALAFEVARDLLELGVFATPVIHPAVPFGQALIRTAVGPAHEPAHLGAALDAFAEVRKRHPIPALDDPEPPVAAAPDLGLVLRVPEAGARA